MKTGRIKGKKGKYTLGIGNGLFERAVVWAGCSKFWISMLIYLVVFGKNSMKIKLFILDFHKSFKNTCGGNAILIY